jgi:Na+/proline symporter
MGGGGGLAYASLADTGHGYHGRMRMASAGIALMALTAVAFTVAGLVYARRRRPTVDEFVTARNSLRPGAAAATLVASGMGGWILFSPAEAAVVGGLPAMVGYGLGSAGALAIFVAVGVRLRRVMPHGRTLPEYVLGRLGKPMYAVVMLTMVFYMAVYLAAELTGIALAAQMTYGVPLAVTASVVAMGTVAYTTAGGLPASVFTDRLQTWLIIPLLSVVFCVAMALSADSRPFSTLAEVAPDLLSFGNRGGMEYGLTLVIAIIGAEVFNQANWQRVYAADSTRTAARAFLLAGGVVLVIVLAMGVFGLLAVAHGAADVPSVAMFTYLLQALPAWVALLTMVLAVTLVMSSMDSLLNGIASLFTVDIAKLAGDAPPGRALRPARWITCGLAVGAAVVATKGVSVLYLFLVADLACVAAAFPVVYCLYSRRLTGWMAVSSTLVGLGAGAALFPPPDFSRGSLLGSFAVALGASSALTVALCALRASGRAGGGSSSPPE